MFLSAPHRRLQNVGFLALARLIVTLPGIVLPIRYGKIGNMADATASDLKTEIRSLRDQVQQQRVQIEALSARGCHIKFVLAGTGQHKKSR
jgi:hypothetical protein